MKTLLIIFVSVMLSLGASAQHTGQYYHPHQYYAPRTRIYVSPFSYGINYGYPYFGYPPYMGYPIYGNRVPYKLSLDIQSIKIDYKSRIKETRKDKSLSHSQKRAQIRSLKTERDQAIIDAQKNFVRSRRMKNNSNTGQY